jgi:hypothetical protein
MEYVRSLLTLKSQMRTMALKLQKLKSAHFLGSARARRCHPYVIYCCSAFRHTRLNIKVNFVLPCASFQGDGVGEIGQRRQIRELRTRRGGSILKSS